MNEHERNVKAVGTLGLLVAHAVAALLVPMPARSSRRARRLAAAERIAERKERAAAPRTRDLGQAEVVP